MPGSTPSASPKFEASDHVLSMLTSLGGKQLSDRAINP